MKTTSVIRHVKYTLGEDAVENLKSRKMCLMVIYERSKWKMVLTDNQLIIKNFTVLRKLYEITINTYLGFSYTQRQVGKCYGLITLYLSE